jgi:hypothetical protein
MCSTTLHGQLKRDIFNHPAWSPDLAPSDYHCFPNLNKFLAPEILRILQETKDAVSTLLKALAATFPNEGIQKLVLRYEKCLNLHGGYLEKQFNLLKTTAHVMHQQVYPFKAHWSRDAPTGLTF